MQHLVSGIFEISTDQKYNWPQRPGTQKSHIIMLMIIWQVKCYCAPISIIDLDEYLLLDQFTKLVTK